jgi:hypothetical protein
MHNLELKRTLSKEISRAAEWSRRREEKKTGKRQKGKGLREPLPPPPQRATGDDRQHSRTWLSNTYYACHAESDVAAPVRRIAEDALERVFKWVFCVPGGVTSG